MPISINGSGTITGISVGGLPDGCVQLADLATTGTASSSTFLRGDAAFAEAGGGKLLGVHTASYTTQTTCSGSGTHDTGLEIVVTPIALGSKFLVQAFQQGQVSINSDPSCVWHARIDRKVASGSFTTVHRNDYLGQTFPNQVREEDVTPLVVYDTPTYSSGQTITYKTTAGIYTSNYGLKYTAQNDGSGNNRSDFIVWEVAQ